MATDASLRLWTEVCGGDHGVAVFDVDDDYQSDLKRNLLRELNCVVTKWIAGVSKGGDMVLAAEVRSSFTASFGIGTAPWR